MRRFAEDSREADLLFGSKRPEIFADIAVSLIVAPQMLQKRYYSALDEEFRFALGGCIALGPFKAEMASNC